MEKEKISFQQIIMQKPLVSVVVPIYKAKDTLYRCLESLKMQTFMDFEVLMVDDGSPDQCGKMIDEYAAKDYRFKAFHKENGGVSSARHFGIDHACGEYTIHADPDDWVEPTMLEELYKKAKEDDADMVICDFYVNTYEGQYYLSQKPSSLHHGIVLKELFEHFCGCYFNEIHYYTLFDKNEEEHIVKLYEGGFDDNIENSYAIFTAYDDFIDHFGNLVVTYWRYNNYTNIIELDLDKK